MTRTTGSRAKKFIMIEKLESDMMDTDGLREAVLEVEEKFSQVRQMPTDEENIEFINTHRVTNKGMQRNDPPFDPVKETIPEFLKSLPEGDDKKKIMKAAAQAAILLGHNPAQIALQYGVPQSIVYVWKDTLITAGAIGRRDKLTDMLMVYIEQELKSLVAISIVTSEERWIRGQSAEGLARFIEVKADRLMAMLSAYGRAEETKKRYMDQIEIIQQHVT